MKLISFNNSRVLISHLLDKEFVKALKTKFPKEKYIIEISLSLRNLEIYKRNKNMSKFKSLEKADVRKVAKDLMEKNGETTTLEIKEELRKRKFWATQNEVALHMNDIEQEDDLNVVPNGVYRVFSVKTSGSSSSGMGGMSIPSALGGNVGISGPSVTPSIRVASGQTKKRTRGQYRWMDATVTTTPKSNDWVVTTVTGSVTMYYKGSVPRYTVRRHFAKTVGEPYINTRAKRVK